jgi:DNA-directed RNA polymerase beta subunit
VPLVILFRALGYDKDRDIFDFICHKQYQKGNPEPVNDYHMMELLKGSFEGDVGMYYTPKDCLLFMGKSKIEYF